ncbi:hypothetical protein [Paenibacillus periandrae]|uniref:hypothetical protein n=1 Tax=Paenibacillus periandrae TaxID=1761741 RepID=UPI001F08A229|nr:hypothetical protein [Paenibacillus periandrae]
MNENEANNMLGYHGTNERQMKKIINSNFKPKKGLWGKGVYLTSSKEGAKIFGNAILKVLIDDSMVTHIDFENFRYLDERSWSKEVANKGYKAIAVSYKSGETEICIFDTEIIKEIQY